MCTAEIGREGIKKRKRRRDVFIYGGDSSSANRKQERGGQTGSQIAKLRLNVCCPLIHRHNYKEEGVSASPLINGPIQRRLRFCFTRCRERFFTLLSRIIKLMYKIINSEHFWSLRRFDVIIIGKESFTSSTLQVISLLHLEGGWGNFTIFVSQSDFIPTVRGSFPVVVANKSRPANLLFHLHSLLFPFTALLDLIISFFKLK